MPAINFSSNTIAIANTGLNGSGIGFFGAAGFGNSVNVGSYNDSTFITDSQGLFQGPQLNNIKYTHPASGSINGLSSVSLLAIPNYLATLKISFTHASPVVTQNAKFRCYDRNNINNNPSGVVCLAAEIVKPDPNQANVNGSGSASWTQINGSGSVLNMVSSPGLSGLRPNGSSTSSTQHDWYLAICQSPSSTGVKTSAGYFSVEYL